MNKTIKVIRNGMIFQMPTSPFSTWRFLGGGTPKTKLPPAAAPTPTPESIDEGATTAGEAERTRLKRRKGRRSTILTEPGLGGETSDRQSLLGNTGV